MSDKDARIAKLILYRKTAKKILPDDLYKLFVSFNQKVFVLSPLINMNNSDGLNEVMEQTNSKTTKKELSELLDVYTEKQKRIVEFENYYVSHLLKLNETKSVIKSLENSINSINKIIREKLHMFNKYPDSIKEKLIYYVAILHDGYALKRRLDSGFRKALEKKNIIELDEYVWRINDLDEFANHIKKRLQRGNYIEWNVDRERTRSRYSVPTNDIYEGVKDYDYEILQLQSELKEQQLELNKAKAKASKLNQQLRDEMSLSLKSYIEANHAASTMSDREIFEHRRLQNLALRWLFKQDYIACSEITLPNNRRADVIGYRDNHVVIIEVKVSEADFKRDNKWNEYLNWCDDFYFFTDTFYTGMHKEVGYLINRQTNNTIGEMWHDKSNHTCENVATVQRLINKTLSSRYIYGF